MAEARERSTAPGARNDRRRPAEHEPDREPTQPSDRQPAAPLCSVGFCPICLVVTAMQPLRPDVLEHLLNAGRELLLAARSVLDARAEATGDDQATKLEKIDIG